MSVQKSNTSFCETSQYDELPWNIIETYFKGQYLNRLVRHQIESYNDFVNNQIKRTIDMFNPINIKSEQDFHEKHKKYGLEINIYFENFRMEKPVIHENNGATKILFPQEARLRNFTYGSSMMIDLNIEILNRYGHNLNGNESHNVILKNIYIGKMPIMLKSDLCVLKQYKHLHTRETGECNYDAGGYFIINGSEKTVLAQERAAENRVYCFKTTKNTKWVWTAEVKSVPSDVCISPKQIQMMISSKENCFGRGLFLQLPRFKNPIPVFIVFRALGVISDKEICNYILLNCEKEENKQYLKFLQASIIDANKCLTKEEAFQEMVNNVMYTPINMDKETGSRKKYDFTIEVIETDLFPHCSKKEEKLFFIGYMANQLILRYFGVYPEDDRDSYVNKRIDTTGVLLNNLFRNYLNKFVKDIQKQIRREIKTGSWRSNQDFKNIINYTNIYKIVKSSTIENGIKRSLATGDFGIKNTNSNKVGVAQVLNRLTYIASLSHLRRVNTPIEKNGKLIQPRKLHSTIWGFICPAETPEGASVGVVKNLSFLTHITIESSSKPIFEILKGKYEPLETYIHNPVEMYQKSKVIVNGNWIGLVENPLELYKFVKMKKYEGIINIYTSVVFDFIKKELRICNDAGRLVRPVWKMENGLISFQLNQDTYKTLLENPESYKWDELITNFKFKNSLIEYIDPEEQNGSLIMMNPKNQNEKEKHLNKYYTHCEIHPSTVLGVLASCIPSPEHNQAPRNTYQSAQAKQAMGIFATNFDQRMDKTAYILHYPTRPLVDTRLMNIIKINNIPSGTNVIVAIATYSGFNQEDSIIFNKGSLDRGLFSATIYHTEKDETKKNNGDEEITCKPDPSITKGMKFANYEKLQSNGLMKENTLIENNDIIIGKVLPIKENKKNIHKLVKYSDQSREYRTIEETYVDKNLVDRNGDGYMFSKVRVRTYRKPVIGDKFSSRAGQKGTIGMILPEEDFPFMSNGVKPDIIINPHAIPSRMTIAQLKESVLGKVLTELGLFGDATSFNELSVNTICKALLKVGYEAHGNELLMNGMNGQQIETSIFIGPTFYQRLKHMVNDKQHSRSSGPPVILTRQPAEGRSRDGGLRFGEMERDAMVAHGATAFAKDRLYDVSDKYQVYVCKDCGMIASVNQEKGVYLCRMCENRTNFALVKIPYACKLLFQELQAMNVAPRIITE